MYWPVIVVVKGWLTPFQLCRVHGLTTEFGAP